MYILRKIQRDSFLTRLLNAENSQFREELRLVVLVCLLTREISERGEKLRGANQPIEGPQRQPANSHRSHWSTLR